MQYGIYLCHRVPPVAKNHNAAVGMCHGGWSAASPTGVLPLLVRFHAHLSWPTVRPVVGPGTASEMLH